MFSLGHLALRAMNCTDCGELKERDEINILNRATRIFNSKTPWSLHKAEREGPVTLPHLLPHWTREKVPGTQFCLAYIL